MEHELENTISLLSHTPAALNALLRDLPETWTRCNEGGDSWNPFEIVGHLAYAERGNWIARAKMLLQFGESRTFEPFDREGQKGDSRGKSLGQVLDEFARRRSENLDQFHTFKLQPEDLTRRGRHPSFGPVTLSQLLATWVAHDLTHLHQLSRVLAYQYREMVGPFRKFLGVLHCDGHSESA